jgi:sugar phosphate isomerase/epimerase
MTCRLACADFTFPLLPHADVLRLITMLGFEGVDIGLFEGRAHLWPSREFADLEGSAAHLKQRLDDLGLAAADIFLQMDPDFTPWAINHPDASRRRHARDWFLRTLDYAAATGARHVTTLPGVEFPEESADAAWSRAAAELAWRVEQASQRSLVFGVEAHVGSLAPDPQRAVKLAQDVPGLTLTVDYTHFTRQGLPDHDVEPMLAYASHFHVRGAQPGRLQVAFKDNVIDYDRVLAVLHAQGYAGWLGVEYVWIDWERCNECDNLSETILFRDYLRAR